MQRRIKHPFVIAKDIFSAAAVMAIKVEDCGTLHETFRRATAMAILLK